MRASKSEIFGHPSREVAQEAIKRGMMPVRDPKDLTANRLQSELYRKPSAPIMNRIELKNSFGGIPSTAALLFHVKSDIIYDSGANPYQCVSTELGASFGCLDANGITGPAMHSNGTA